ncbi:hypothetical protein L1987_16541 [Smallanthus sonchifolius]|uniref:Uncharacterized protein n=1 Tax=Smallanthus sonchifolius TaxID=185202 RepID=A0ACB9JAS7_9ASTR|nr:hypothetical protein L1987_16541 [Smallanthus sonchifolius]
MLGTVGRPNPAYSSSLEKTKAGKKPKGNEDVFGLDPLIGIESEFVGEDHGNRELDSLDDSADFVTPTHVDEIEATINLGGKLGANLITAHELILDSIVNEGLQGGGVVVGRRCGAVVAGGDNHRATTAHRGVLETWSERTREGLQENERGK